VYRTILLAVDGSKHSSSAIHAAADLAQAFHSEVVVVHARQIIMSTALFGADPIGMPMIAAEGQMALVEQDFDADARHLVDRVTQAFADLHVKARGEVVSGRSAARLILGAADDCDADLIVIGSRGLSDLTGLLLGSVAHQVVQYANCPVLVARG
jgi:nucleotide-binding universal stress UspA family protein